MEKATGHSRAGHDVSRAWFRFASPNPDAVGMKQTIIPNRPVMTRICPDRPPKAVRILLASMDELTGRFAPVAPAHSCLSLVDLRLLAPLMTKADSADALNSLLSPAEIQLLAGFTYPKRRIEWLGGRLAAKYGLQRLLPDQAARWRDFSILPDTHGRPRVQSPSHCTLTVPSVSISHSRDYAAALVSNAPLCGLDIQQKTPQLITVQERFAAEAELALLSSIPEQLTRLALLWAVKEAVKKGCLADHPSFFGAIRLTTVHRVPDESSWTALCQVTQESGRAVRVHVAEFDTYLIAWVEGEDHA